MAMNCKERMIRAITMTGPDQIPRRSATWPGAYEKYGQALGELYRRYPTDLLFVRSRDERDPSVEMMPVGANRVDRWGCRWTRASTDTIGYQTGHPLADWDALKDYQFPEPLWDDFERVAHAIKEDHGERYVLVDGSTLFQRMWRLRGMENTLIDLIDDREEIHWLRDRILDSWILTRIERWGEIGVDGLHFRDDWGTQQQLMVRPSLWRSFFKPAYKRIIDAAHEAGAFLHFHTDGMVRDIIPDLIEIGVDLLNIQGTLMGIQDLGREIGGKVCVEGDIDRQFILPNGTVEDVVAHVHQYIEAFGTCDGGFTAYVQVSPNVPLANVEAALRTLWEYNIDHRKTNTHQR
jgi:uroporphyrinogen decarboxylase